MEDISSDAEILQNLSEQKNMNATIRILYQQNFDALRHFVLHNNGSAQDAEDIFQEVLVLFIRLVQKGKFRGESSIKTFLYALNRNKWLNELKRRGRELKREEKYETLNDGSAAPNVTTLIETREANQFIMDTMNALGENCKKILLFYYYENYAMREIVEIMHYENEQVVRNKKYKCLKSLQVLLMKNPHIFKRLKTLLNE